MPFSFVEIEKAKTRKIYLLFIFLIVFYFVSAWIIAVTLRFSFLSSTREHLSYALQGETVQSLLFLSPHSVGVIFLIALGAGLIHWSVSVSDISAKILNALGAYAPDPDDDYHKRLQNIIDEVNIARGGKKVECVILPIAALNAFSVMDFNGREVIGVTEGLLGKLNRPQLEAVIAHEVAHLVSKDTLINSVAVSLFGMYGLVMAKLQSGFGSGSGVGGRWTYSRRGSGQLVLLYVVLAVITVLGKLICAFISRNCEYRADAVAVRLVRDPYSLAQSLYLISKKWRGGGFGYEHLESLFIINPQYAELDEQQGLFADLFSTHPPVNERIRILLDMAHANLETLEKETHPVEKHSTNSQAVVIETPKDPLWFVNRLGNWQGPFSAAALKDSDVFKDDLFVKKAGSSVIHFAHEDEELLSIVKNEHADKGSLLCPRCLQPLQKAWYESVPVHRCVSCQGTLVPSAKIPRIFLRSEEAFSADIEKKAAEIEEMAQTPFAFRNAKIQHELKCPQCGNTMVRSFYSLVYPVQIDSCVFPCGVTWFDKDELEVVQYLVEKNEDASG